MSWITSLVSALKADNGVKAIVSTRVHPQPLTPDVALPAITWSVPDEDTQTALSGAVVSSTATVYLHCWGETESQARSLADAVKSVLLSFATDCEGVYNIHAVGVYEVEPEIRRIVLSGDVLVA